MKIDVKHEAALREALFASQVLVAGPILLADPTPIAHVKTKRKSATVKGPDHAQ